MDPPLAPPDLSSVEPRLLASLEPSEEVRPANLAAVESFLQRTLDYEIPADDPPVEVAQPPKDGFVSKPVTAARQPNPDRMVGTPRDDVPAESSEPTPSESELFANTQVELASHSDGEPRLALPVIRTVSIQTPPAVAANPSEPAVEKVTNTPIDLENTLQRPVSLDELIRDLKDRADRTSDLDTQWQLSMMQLALGRDDEAAELSDDLSPSGRRILGGLVELAAAVRGAARNPLQVGAPVLERVDALRGALEDLADPVVRSIALCRRVVTFGVYDEMDEREFVAGRTTRTIVYCEVRNFKSQQTSEGQFQAVLGTRLEVLSADGTSMWQREEPEIEDLCRRRRTDFFLAQRVTLPPTLPAGEYVLKVYVEDRLSGRASEAAHPFTIIEQATLTAGR